MLAHADAIATVGVRDIEAAREFYGNVLGLLEEESDQEEGGVLIFRSGNSRVQVYRSDYAGSNQATAITWDLGERIVEIVDALKAKGATFERYDVPGMRLEGELYVSDGFKVTWLKDPDGNILSLYGR
ncbi:VOC family protein [uncultured Massilia sp.]|uniref:VOC family protein n=1 Tax=uncultured Massilia sp. TaxID=169973 RepID=UPI00258EDF59|nr:VOC family protein [uncultured Massilia sp.]